MWISETRKGGTKDCLYLQQDLGFRLAGERALLETGQHTVESHHCIPSGSQPGCAPCPHGSEGLLAILSLLFWLLLLQNKPLQPILLCHRFCESHEFG